MIQVNFGYTATLSTTQAVQHTALTVAAYRELPVKRELHVQFTELPYEILLWSGDDYDAIAADWTDADVEDRMKVLYPNV